MTIFEMPPIPREAFATEEDYQRALVTSTTTRTYAAEGTTMVCTKEQIPTILTVLVNAAHAVGMGVLHDANTTFETQKTWVDDDFEKYGEEQYHTDYINGRSIKTSFKKLPDGTYKFNTRLYNRDQGGTGTAERLLASLDLTVLEDTDA